MMLQFSIVVIDGRNDRDASTTAGPLAGTASKCRSIAPSSVARLGTTAA
jgi:hypothetical protein